MPDGDIYDTNRWIDREHPASHPAALSLNSA